MTYEIHSRPSEILVGAIRRLPAAHDGDLPSMLIEAGLVLALAGHTEQAFELWRRALDPKLPGLNHVYGTGPLVSACGAAGMDVAPDGTVITEAVIDVVDRTARDRLNPAFIARKLYAEMPSLRPRLPGVDERMLVLEKAFELALTEGPGTWREEPTPREAEAVDQLERWCALANNSIAGAYEYQPASLVAADIHERMGNLEAALARLAQCFRASEGTSSGFRAGDLLQLQPLARLAAKGALASVFGLTDLDCDAAAPKLIAAADRRLAEGRVAPPKRFDWKSLLDRINARALASADDYPGIVSDEKRAKGWLGEPPAKESAVAGVERHFGISLPPSYRAFLKVSNGFGPITYSGVVLRPVDGIRWFNDEDPETVALWNESAGRERDVEDAEYLVYGGHQAPVRRRYLKTALQVSDWSDGDVVLLIPDVVNAAGEWETWYFGPAFAGAWRFPSFVDFMQEGTFARDREG